MNCFVLFCFIRGSGFELFGSMRWDLNGVGVLFDWLKLF